MNLLSKPSDIIRFIESDEHLARLAAENSLTREAVLDSIVGAYSAEDVTTMLRAWALDAISTAFAGERKKVRINIRDGRPPNTVFGVMVDEEYSTAEVTENCRTAAMREILYAANNAILDTWMMSNGRCLGDCTAGEVRKEAWREKQIANGHLRKADFYIRISEGLSDNSSMRLKRSEHIEAIRLAVFGEPGEGRAVAA